MQFQTLRPSSRSTQRIRELGALGKDDDDGSENVGKKMDSLKLNCVCLEPLNMSNARDVSRS